MSQIHIKLKKRKFYKFGIMSAFMLVLSFLFLFFPKAFTSNIITSTYLVSGIGIVGVAFFGIATLYNWRKILNSKLGIYISEEGMMDLTSVFRIGWIEWKDIVGFTTKKISKTEVICIETSNPEKYLERLKSPVLRKASEQNLRIYGTPFFINTSSLSMSSAELEKVLNEELKKRKV